MSWKYYTDEELLGLLKKEIERLGLQDKPSRTELHELYDNRNMPSPNTYINRFNATWEELMNRIGIDYDLDKIRSEHSKKVSRRKRAGKWGDQSREELLDIAVSEIRRLNIDKANEYEDLRNKDEAPSMRTLYNQNIYWGDIKGRYEQKYGSL